MQATTLYEGAAGSENTLDYWGGYTLNPSDTRWVAERLKLLAGEAPLLKEAGSVPGRGYWEVLVDLRGQLDEWAAGADGQGGLLGRNGEPADEPHNGPPEASA